jgi:hypothetical protein
MVKERRLTEAGHIGRNVNMKAYMLLVGMIEGKEITRKTKM